jgi:N4-gp56 family major capsid protein
LSKFLLFGHLRKGIIVANTNFGLLTSNEKLAHSMEFWSQARNYSFINKFMGKSSSSIIQHITELTSLKGGTKAVITLVADMEGDGVVGDRTLKGNEEVLKSYEQVITFDQIRNANHNEGRMADQKTIINFREHSKDKLAYWAADRIDQLAFLTLSGVSYTLKPNGATRVGSDFPYLEFAKDVSAPTSKRFGQWDEGTKQILWGTGTAGIVGGAVGTGDYPCWEMFVQAKAYAKDNHIRGTVSKANGEELFHVFLTPQAMARLKLDPTYMANLRHAQTRDGGNALFTGSSVNIDGIVLHEFRHVFNTSGAASGSKWGLNGLVDGCQILFCGAQAMGMADIGNAEWDEEKDDYSNSFGIAIAKQIGFLKPKFYTQYSGGTVQDHGVISLYCAQ